ncbi:MAG: [protein-PII] uridylyltransferase [Myxococcales bacterium]|nr:[protein-PII] uridylyltransferase [Myxococcales bacterium]
MTDEPLKSKLASLRERLLSALPTEGAPNGGASWGLALGRSVAHEYDELLRPVFAAADGKPVALAAVGGYGRGAVALRSDLDVRVLARRVEEAEQVVDAVLYPLWDAGFAIGHQVLLLGDVVELARTDLATATSLLDWRHLAGDRSLSDEVVWRVSGSLFAASELARFGERLAEEVERRHERFGDSVFLLEPDVKNGAGGLRDLDVLRWSAHARYGAGEIGGLVRVGALVPREALDLAEAEELLWQIRHLLHAHAGRRSDRLTFDEQEAISRALGYGADTDGVEKMMSAYYRAARVISRGRATMLARASHESRRRPKAEDLGDGLRLFDDSVTLDDATRIGSEPELALRLVAVAVDKNRPIHAHARELIQRFSNDMSWCERLRKSRLAARAFVEIVSNRKETKLTKGSALRELHELGLLLAMIPEFSPVVGRVHHDLYHVYTVDVHSVAAVDRLAALARGDLASQYPLASRLAAEVLSPTVLAFATLLHDVGKAIGRRDHSERGAEMADVILSRLDFRPEEIEEAARLIRHHLTMYLLATRRDIDDPATAAELIETVPSRESLRNLYLLTIVDVSTTSPTSLTSWKAHLLDELYIAADEALTGASGEIGRAELLRKEVLGFAEGYSELGASRREWLGRYLESMPDRYLLASSAQAIVEHAEVVRSFREGGVSIEVVPSSHPEATELCVVADDRPGLLALISAALTTSKLEVLGAQVYTRMRDDGSVQAVDLFWVQSRVEGSEAVLRALSRLRRDLEAMVSGAARPQIKLGPASPTRRGAPKVATRVALDHRASREHTIIEVVTQDRPGVLFAIANALYELGLAISVAKINTEGARAIDVFYVRDASGKKLDAGKQSAEVEEGVLRALGEAPSDARGPAGDPRGEGTPASKHDTGAHNASGRTAGS